MRAVSLLVASALAFLTISIPADAKVEQPFVIGDDHGGDIDAFLMWYGRLRESGVPVVLRGICESACTFVLTLPREQVCVERGASLGFHHATVDGKNEPEITAAVAARFYPPAVLKWLSDKKLRSVPIYLHAEAIVSLGIFPACSPTIPTSDTD